MDANTSRPGPQELPLPVTAGIDGSGAGLRGAVWAAREALARSVPLRLVDVLAEPDSPAARPGGIHYRDAQRTLDIAKHAVEQRIPADARERLEIRTEIGRGRPASALAERTRSSSLLVLGSAEIGPVRHLMLGSTALEVTRTAACPVALIRHTDSAHGPVLVVVEGWPSARPALLAGFHAARTRGGEVTVARVWHGPEWTTPTDWYLDKAVVSDQQIEHCRREFPEITVRPITVVGDTITAIETFSALACLVIVVRDRSIAHPDRLGPISRDLVRHAPCPVLVLPEPNGTAERGETQSLGQVLP
ncbi:universal stress protein [Nocardia inohanensis]|uniref:universal stress protein n=1 Tax=Nocardia inohanensis TaxID=209246 RepID=UPI0008361CE0|nr:universal stress protein [Nocardia inohanensis]